MYRTPDGRFTNQPQPQTVNNTPKPINVLNQARHTANWQRGQAITRLKNGQLTPHQLIQLAKQHPYLQKISLQTIIQNTPNLPRNTKNRWRQKLAQQAQKPLPENPNIAWLIDQRAGQKRIRAFQETLNTQTTPPWPGWPYTPKPQHPGQKP